jgi:DNA-binding response OmpR family regulator
MDTSQKTVLCIEDDRFIGEMYVRAMQQADYVVDWVLNGSDGLAAAQSKQYDFILLDIMLPERQGTEVLEELRGKQDTIPHSKVIVLTNFDQDDASRRAMESKAQSYLIKADITPRHLLQVMQDLA